MFREFAPADWWVTFRSSPSVIPPCRMGACTLLPRAHVRCHDRTKEQNEVHRVFQRNLVYVVLLLWPAFALAAEPGNPAIRAAVETFINARDISGAVTVVAAKDKLLAVDTIGLADITKKKPMKLDSLFWIASMTKPFTAVSILMLQDEGKLQVSDPVEKFIPEFAALKTPAGQPAHITIEQILTHTSGLGEGDTAAIKSCPYSARADPHLSGIAHAV